MNRVNDEICATTKTKEINEVQGADYLVKCKLKQTYLKLGFRMVS